MKKDSHLRSVVKGTTYRAYSTFVTMFISYGVTGSFSMSWKIGLIEVVVKIFSYYIHERVWSKIK